MYSIIVCLLFATTEAAPTPPPFKLESVTVNQRIDPKGGFFSETSSWTEADLPTSYIQHYLTLDAPEAKIPLGMETEEFGDSCPPRGMDPKTLQVHSVGTSGVLAVTWKTHMVWGGRWELEAMLILQRSTKGWNELFRDYHQSYYRAGAGYNNSASLTFEADTEHENAYALTVRRINIDTSKAPKPMYRKDERPDEPLYLLKETTSVKWPCKIENGQLVCGEGIAFLELGDSEFPIDEVAAALLAGESNETAVPEKVEQLRTLNLRLNKTTMCTGNIVTGTAPPYVPQPEHRWSSL
ncbi:MAG: hypothetical protein IT366_16100 [Candidatus Hydrogenedentes bacterium]|nr:hypothetical protein [Candidatus Hydrogenedentota bacterium]